jgi:hypothetical protein
MCGEQGVRDTARLEFFIGRDKGGNWIVIETHGLAGGYFVSAREALRYVVSGYQDRVKRIEMVEGVLDPGQSSCADIADRCRAIRAA